jgi:hypothetical protein
VQSTEEDDMLEWIWEIVFIPEDGIDEAVTVVKFVGTSCTGALGIPRRGFSCRQRDLV